MKKGRVEEKESKKKNKRLGVVEKEQVKKICWNKKKCTHPESVIKKRKREKNRLISGPHKIR